MIKRALLISACLAATPLASNAAELPADVHSKIVAGLKDPDSAQFRSVTSGQKGDQVYYCGEVNAKNSYGGYEGFQRFVWNGKGVMIWNDPKDRGALGDELFEKAFERHSANCG